MVAEGSSETPKRIHKAAGATSQETILFIRNKMRVSKMKVWFLETDDFNPAFPSVSYSVFFRVTQELFYNTVIFTALFFLKGD
jgi:hypothetical protein